MVISDFKPIRRYMASIYNLRQKRPIYLVDKENEVNGLRRLKL